MVLGLLLERGASHMTLRLTTRDLTRRFEWSPRNAAFEAAVADFAGLVGSDGSAAIVASLYFLCIQLSSTKGNNVVIPIKSLPTVEEWVSPLN